MRLAIILSVLSALLFAALIALQVVELNHYRETAPAAAATQ